MFGLINANSSRYNKLGDNPRIPSLDVAATTILEPLLNCIDILFHNLTPGCNHMGNAI